MKKGVIVGVVVGIAALVGFAIIFGMTKDPLSAIRGAEVQNQTSPDVVTAEQATGVSDVSQKVATSTTVDLISETYLIAPDSETIIKFTTAPSEKAYVVGTATVTGGSGVWLEIRNASGECAFYCSKEIVWDAKSGNPNVASGENNEIRLVAFTGSEQQLVLYPQGSREQTITVELQIEYVGTGMTEAKTASK